MLKLLFESVTIAVFAFMWITVLTAPANIFFKLKEWLYIKLHEKVYHVLFGCYNCLAGQISLWYYLFVYQPNTIYEFSILFCFVIYSIFAAKLIGRLFEE